MSRNTGPTSIVIHPQEVHIWEIILFATNPVFYELSTLLNPEEHIRANRISITHNRRLWIIVRAALRDILSRYIGLPPNDIVFRFNTYGKPMISGEGQPIIHFNLSHSKNVALLVISLSEIGVDIEYINPKTDWNALCKHVLSEQETTHIIKCEPQSQRRMFFQIWTAKEAYMKGLGLGFSLSPKSFNFIQTLCNNDISVVVDTKQHDGKSWKICIVNLQQNTYVASIAYAETSIQQYRFIWNID